MQRISTELKFDLDAIVGLFLVVSIFLDLALGSKVTKADAKNMVMNRETISRNWGSVRRETSQSSILICLG